MKKLILIFLITIFTNLTIPYKYNINTINAGVLSWGAKKVISGIVKLIFNTASDKIVEYQKNKLIAYLRKHPEHIKYTKKLIMKQIDKYPKYKQRGYILLNAIIKQTNNKIYK